MDTSEADALLVKAAATPLPRACDKCYDYALREGNQGGCVDSMKGCQCEGHRHTAEDCDRTHSVFAKNRALSRFAPGGVAPAQAAPITSTEQPRLRCQICRVEHFNGEAHRCEVCQRCRAHVDQGGRCFYWWSSGCECGGYQHTDDNCVAVHSKRIQQLIWNTAVEAEQQGYGWYGSKQHGNHVGQVAQSGDSTTGQASGPIKSENSNPAGPQSQLRTSNAGQASDLMEVDVKKSAPAGSQSQPVAGIRYCPWCLEDLGERVQHRPKNCPRRGDKCEHCGSFSRYHFHCPHGNCYKCWENKNELHKHDDCPLKKPSSAQEPGTSQHNSKKRKEPPSAQHSGASQPTSNNRNAASSVNADRQPSPNDSPALAAAWQSMGGRFLMENFINRGIRIPDAHWYAFQMVAVRRMDA